MKPGLYVLASLNGAPLDSGDMDAMGLSQADPPSPFYVHSPGFTLRLVDQQPEAMGLHRNGQDVAALMGFLDEPEELRALLHADAAAPPVVLAAAALDRFGVEASRRMLGEWTFLRWSALRRELTLLTSESRRDTVLFASAGGLLALAPSALRLGTLRWVGLALDPEGMALTASRAGLRHIKTEETKWRGIREIAPARLERFSASGRTTSHLAPLEPQPRWSGTFEEAAEALEATGRRIVRQHMSRHPRSAFLLSGGLDSTLLSSWGAFERGPGREMFCISSMAPPGSGVPDESDWSRAAAESLGVPLQGVWPGPEENLFRPDPEIFEQLEGAPEGRFLTYRALDRAALQGGATAILDGANGEMHVSNGFDGGETRSWLRIRASLLRDRLRHRRQYSGWPADAFHLRFAPELLETLPPGWGGIWRKGPPVIPGANAPWGSQDALLGVSHAASKMASIPTQVVRGLRHYLPYRDRRLLHLAAGMPVSFLSHQGQTRPFARAMLLGRVPDAVRLRTQGRPFSPDYVPKLKAQATAALDRVPLLRSAGVGHWLDLDWLQTALPRLATAPGETDYAFYYRVHLTALSAEFLLWCSAQGVRL